MSAASRRRARPHAPGHFVPAPEIDAARHSPEFHNSSALADCSAALAYHVAMAVA